MEKSLFKKFENIYFQLQILREKAKGWKISEKDLKEMDKWLKVIDDAYQKAKEKYEREAKPKQYLKFVPYLNLLSKGRKPLSCK